MSPSEPQPRVRSGTSLPALFYRERYGSLQLMVKVVSSCPPHPQRTPDHTGILPRGRWAMPHLHVTKAWTCHQGMETRDGAGQQTGQGRGRARTISIQPGCVDHAVEQTSIPILLQVAHLQESCLSARTPNPPRPPGPTQGSPKAGRP